MRKSRPKQCPACGSKSIARIQYGLPVYSEELQKQLDSGAVVLGGCCVTGEDPRWHCNACENRWD